MWCALDLEAPEAPPRGLWGLQAARLCPATPPTPTLLPASLTAALPRHAAATASRKGFLVRALGGRGGGNSVGRTLLAPVQVAATRNVWGSGHPVAQVRRGAERPCRESAAKALLISGTPAIAQAIEAVRAPWMHRRRGRMRRAHPEPTTAGATATSGHTDNPPPSPPSPPPRSPPPPARPGKLTTGSHVANPEVHRARDCSLFLRSLETRLLGTQARITGSTRKLLPLGRRRW